MANTDQAERATDTGRPLAPIRLTNAAAQLVLRTQVRRKEKGRPYIYRTLASAFSVDVEV